MAPPPPPQRPSSPRRRNRPTAGCRTSRGQPCPFPSSLPSPASAATSACHGRHGARRRGDAAAAACGVAAAAAAAATDVRAPGSSSPAAPPLLAHCAYGATTTPATAVTPPPQTPYRRLSPIVVAGLLVAAATGHNRRGKVASDGGPTISLAALLAHSATFDALLADLRRLLPTLCCGHSSNLSRHGWLVPRRLFALCTAR